MTAAINDAPMGDLTFEDEVFDVARLRTSSPPGRVVATGSTGWRHAIARPG